MAAPMEFEKVIVETESRIQELKKLSQDSDVNFSSEIRMLEKRIQKQLTDIYSDLSTWQIVQVARHPERPVLKDYISAMCQEFIELHGDRSCSDDRALIGGFASIDGTRVMLIGHNKGKTPEENIHRNFGMANPGGYRKALRLMKMAEKYNLPVVSFIDTQGAFPGMEAEERGQAEAIARNLTEMATLEVPIVALVTGEGGSGGAIGIGVGDVVMMLTNAIYSVISPEGCASILWRDAKFAPDAAEALRITAASLLELGVIEEIIPEPVGGAHRNYEETIGNVKGAVLKHLKSLSSMTARRLQRKRMERYARLGKFSL